MALIIVIGALVRHLLNRIDAGDDWDSYGWTLPVAAMALYARRSIVTAPAPRRAPPGPRSATSKSLTIAAKHCVMCHSRNRRIRPSRSRRRMSCLKRLADCAALRQQIYMQTVQNRAMPLGNQTGMTQDERDKIGAWIAAQK